MRDDMTVKGWASVTKFALALGKIKEAHVAGEGVTLTKEDVEGMIYGVRSILINRKKQGDDHEDS